MSSSAANELGFAEFVAKLIADTFNAILLSEAHQKNKINELRALLAMNEEEFIDACMQDAALLDQVDTELQVLFAADNQVGHSVIAGSAYVPHKKGAAESPPYLAVLGVSLVEEEDFYPERAAKYNLSDAGVNKIERAIMTTIARQQRASIDSLMADGIPKLVVDSGKINAKLTFSIELFDHSDDEEASDTEGYQRPTPLPPAGMGSRPVATEPAGDTKGYQRPTPLPPSGMGIPSTATESAPPRSSEDLLIIRRRSQGAAEQFALNTNSRFLGSVDTQSLLRSRLKVTPASNTVPQDGSSAKNIYSEVEIHFKTIL